MKKFNKAKKTRQEIEPEVEKVINKPIKNKIRSRSYYDDIDSEKWSKKKFLDEYYEEE